MDDALLMRGFEGIRDLSRDRQRIGEGDPPLRIRSASVGPSTNSNTSARTATCPELAEGFDSSRP